MPVLIQILATEIQISDTGRIVKKLFSCNLAKNKYLDYTKAIEFNPKRGLRIKVHAFLICMVIQDIEVVGFDVKPVVSPTYCDLVNL